MKKGVIYRLIFGKGNNGDFTVANLPKNRVKQFLYVFKRRFGTIFRVNLLTALFALPLIAWDFVSTAYVADFTKGMDAQTQFSHLLRLSLLRYGTQIPMIMLTCVGLAGAFYVIRQLCWGAPVSLLRDYKKGIKGAYKQFLLLGLLAGTVNFAFSYLLEFCLLTVSAKTEFAYVLAIVGIILAAIIGFTALVYAMAQSSLYGMTFFGLIKSSFILTFKRLFRSVGVVLLSLLPVLLFRFFPWAFMQIIGDCLIVVFSIGFAVTMQTVLCHGVFDAFINEKSYPNFVNLGLNTGMSYYKAMGIDDEDDDSDGESDEEENENKESDDENCVAAENENACGANAGDNGAEQSSAADGESLPDGAEKDGGA